MRLYKCATSSTCNKFAYTKLTGELNVIVSPITLMGLSAFESRAKTFICTSSRVYGDELQSTFEYVHMWCCT